MVYTATKLRQESVRLLMVLASTLLLRIWSQDVTQANLQLDKKLRRRFYLRGQKEFGLTPDELMLLLKLFYGLSDSEEY